MTIDLIHIAIHLKNGQAITPVDLGGGRVAPEALGHVSVQDGTALHVLETKFTEKEFRQTGVLLWVGRRVPRLNVVATKLDRRRTPSSCSW